MAQKYSLARSLRIFHQVHCLISFPQETWTWLWKPSLHTHTHTHVHTHTNTQRSLCLHTADVEDSSLLNWLWGLNESWSQTCFHDSPGHRPIPGSPFQAGATAKLFPDLTPPAGYLDTWSQAWELGRNQSCSSGKNRRGGWSWLPWIPSLPLPPWCLVAMESQRPQVQFSSVTQSCPTLCDPMECIMPSFPVHYQLPEPTQTPVHHVGDVIKPSHPLLSPSPAFNLSQYQGLFQWVGSLH